MPRGGARKGAGRPKGAVTKRTEEALAIAAKADKTPLEYMIEFMTDKNNSVKDRLSAAQAAAPYVHPKLSAVAMDANVSMSHEAALMELMREDGAESDET